MLFDHKIDKNQSLEYINLSSNPRYSDQRNYLNLLWKKYEPYADTNFLQEFKINTHSRFWEMYLGCILIENGKKLIKRTSNYGPDFKIQDNNQTIWVEATAPTGGKENDSTQFDYL